MYNRAKGSAPTYELGRLLCWLRDPTPASEKSTLFFLPVLLLVVGTTRPELQLWLDVKFPASIVPYARLDADATGAAVTRCPYS